MTQKQVKQKSPSRRSRKHWAQTHREAEVERLGHPKLARPDVVEVPGDDEVDDRVDEQHNHGVKQREVVVYGGRFVEVAPLCTLTWGERRMI